MKPWSLWILALAITGAVCVYHVTKGPYAPVRGTKDVGGTLVTFELSKQHWGSGEPMIRMKAATSVEGTLAWRHGSSDDRWTYVRMERQGDSLAGRLPSQPPGQRIEYRAVLQDWGERVWLTGPPVRLRYFGDVPAPLRALYLVGLVAALMVASRTGLDAWMAKEPRLNKLVQLATILFVAACVAGGAIIGWLALGTPWSGWPLSGDWTDTITLLVAVAWTVALAGVRCGWKVHRVIVFAVSMATVSAYFAAHGFPA